MENKTPTFHFHRFLDEAGDTTFYGKGKIPLIGTEGVSKHFILGMLSVNEPLETLRSRIIDLQKEVEADPWFLNVKSINKSKNKGGYFLHAKNDVPEVRKMFFELIQSVNCQLHAVVGRKDYSVYEKKHNGKQAEFYADLLSHLLNDSLNGFEKLVLNIAHRSRCTTHLNLDKGLEKAKAIAKHKFPDQNSFCKPVYNVQPPSEEPLINIADYLLWAIQRKLERGENRYYDFIGDKISKIEALYID